MSQQQVESSLNNIRQEVGSDNCSDPVAPQTLETQIQAVQLRVETILRSEPADKLPPDLQAQLQQTQGLLAELQAAAVQYQSRMVQAWRDQQVMQLTQRLRHSLNPIEIAEQTAGVVQQLLQVDRVAIYQLKESGEAMVIAEAVRPDWELEANHIAPLLHQTCSLTVAELGQSFSGLALDQTDQLPADLGLKQFVAQQQSTALLLAPVQQDGTILGLISAHQLTEPRQWQADEINLLQRLSGEVALALRQSELYQQAQQANADLEQQVRQRTRQLSNALDYESTLKRITDRVRDSLDERHILEAALQELTVVLKLAGCNAAVYDLNQGTSTVQYEFTQSLPTLQGRVAQMEDFPEIYQQLKQGRWFQFCSLLPNPVRGRVAMLACPIFVDPQSSRGVDQSVLGDLWLIHHPDHMFDEYEIRLVQQVANQCAIAIRQARLYQAAQGQVQELAELNRL
ncbi:MAG: GAF domain-containing protein, partial [Elainella sp.]